MDRRQALLSIGTATSALLADKKVHASAQTKSEYNGMGVLVDTTVCIGCRKCEWACNDTNQLPNQTIESFEDKSVFFNHRYPDASRYTVVNEYRGEYGEKPIWVKTQCMHCNDPACVSACLVSALQKNENGAVTYDASRCMGCRYCMVACPFQANAYEYSNAFTPQVRKCTLCIHRTSKEGGVPACVEICPPQCLTFGKRKELVALAHQNIESDPDRYLDHIYGEFEVGGTSWMYLASKNFKELGFPVLGTDPPPRLTEGIQHGIFRYFIPPLALYFLLAGVMHLSKPEEETRSKETASGGEAS